MTYLELCKRVRRETRIPGTGPSTVSGQTGLLQDVVSAVRDAWNSIQLTHHESWVFLRGVDSVELHPGVNVYTVADLGIPEAAIILNVKDSQGRLLRRVDWEEAVIKFEPRELEPDQYTVDPQNHIVFNNKPTGFLSFFVTYVREIQQLQVDSDEPSLPERHHDVIVWKAVMDLAANESDTVIYQKAFEKYDGHLSRLMVESLPLVSTAFRGIRFP